VSAKGRYVNIGGKEKFIGVIRDERERKKGETELKESEEKYRNIVDSIPIGMHMYQLDANNNLVFTGANPSADKILGVNNIQFIGKTIEEAFPPLANTEIPERYRQAAKEGKTWSTESITYKDNQIQGAYEVNSFQISPSKMVASFFDITERVRSEQKLKESEETYRTLFENSPIALMDQDFSEMKKYIDHLKASGINDFKKYFDDNHDELLKTMDKTKIVDVNKKTLEVYKAKSKEDFFSRVNQPKENMDNPMTEEAFLYNEMEILSLINGETTYDSEIETQTFKGDTIHLYAKTAIVSGFENTWSKVIVSIVNITERKEAEQKLKKSEERYRSFIEDAQEGVWALDENENTTFVNPRMCEMLGYTKDEMMGKNLHLLIPDSMKERIKGNRIRREKGIKETYDLELVKKDGTSIYTNIKAAPIMSESRNYKGSFAYITDITIQKQAEDTLRESEEKFRTLFEIVPASIIVSDLESNITLFNQKFCHLHGITQPELLKGRKIQEFIAERDRPRLKEAIIKTYREEPRGPIQYTMYKEDGTEFLAEGTSSALKDKNGKNIGLIGIAQDITERVRSEQKLKESEEKYHALFENAPIGVAISDYEGNVIDINEHMKKLLGYELKELQKLGVATTYANDQDRIPFKNRLEEHGYIQDYEVDLKKKDGNVFPALINSIKTNISGEPIYINTIRDISEKKEIEEIKTHLLKRFSHEFKTPLISIKGFSDLLLSEYKYKLDEKTIGFLERIKKGANRLNVLINAFMESSELGEKLTNLNKDKENLSDLIKLGVSEMEGLIHLRKHTINVDIPEELIGEFDKEKIYTVITNLLMNAINYTPPEGKIFIHAKIEARNIFFSIKDSGIGLMEEDKRHLFKSFGKIEKYGKGWDIVSEGMGVGLYLSKEIINLHGGKIWAESEGENKGSTFYFSLPIT
jgi:PAS domain S-box-containing protein